MKQKALILATAVGVPVVLLLLIEVGLRLGGYGTRPDFFVPIEGQQAWTTNPNFARLFFPPALARLPQPLRVPFEKPADVTRVVVLGGSAAMGEPEPAYAFSRVLDAMLHRRYPGRRFEVINTGMATINSHVIRLIAEECHKLEADVAIVYAGNNEVVGPFGAGTVFGRFSPSLTMIRLGTRLRSLRLGQLIESATRWATGAAQYVVEGQGMAVFRDQFVASGDPRLETVYGHFERNLEAIVESLREGGSQVLVSTVGANLLDHAPFASVYGQATGIADPMAWGEGFADGITELAKGDTVAAVAAFETANRVDSTHAELRFRLGQLTLALGDTTKAVAHFRSAREHDALRFRVDERINGTIVQVAEGTGVRLVDAAGALGKQDAAGVGIPGQDTFHEHVHLTFRGNHLVAEYVADALVEDLGPARGPATADSLAADLALTDYDRYRLFASVVGLTGRAPFTNQYDFLDGRRRAHRKLNTLMRAGTSHAAVDEALGVYRTAIARRPDDLVLRQNHARLLQEAGRLVEATVTWKRLLEAIPSAPTWRLAFATALSDQGAHQAALHAYRELEQQMPGLVLPHIQIGFELVSTGRIGEAIGVLQEALAINPGSILARLNLSALLEDVGEGEAAGRVIDDGLALVRLRDDAHGEANLLAGRAELLSRRGDRAGEVEALGASRVLYELTQDVVKEAVIRVRLARAIAATGDTDAAMVTLEEAIAFCRDFALEEAEAQCHVARGMILLKAGDREGAEAAMEKARELRQPRSHALRGNG